MSAFNKIKKLSAFAVTTAMAFASASAFGVSTNYYRTGFEPTPNTTPGSDYPLIDANFGNPAGSYTAGNLIPQNNWQDANGGNGSAGTPSVISTAGLPGVSPAQGAQAVRMIAQGGAGGTYADVYTSDTNLTAGQVAGYGNVVNVSWDMSRAGGAGKATAFGIEILSKNQDAVLASLFLGNDNTNTQALLTEDVNNTPSTYAGFGRSDNTWASYHIQMDFSAKTFTVFVDGNNVAAQFPMSAAAQAALSSEGNAIGGIAFANTNDGTDTAYYDNFQVVPEPTGVAMVGLGTLLLLAKRPKRLA